MEDESIDRRVVGGIAGIASPVVFTAFVATSGAIVPHYDHVSQHVSELARQDGPHAWVMRLGLVIVGVLDLVLARGLARGAPSRAGRIGSGFVDTPLTRRNRFPMPFMMTPEAAAERIVRGLLAGHEEIHFPRRLSLPLKLLGALPRSLYERVVRLLTGTGRPPRQ